MKLSIRTRLTFQFSYIVSFILVLFSFIIYYFSSDYRRYEFYMRLERKAINTAKLLIEVKEVDYNLLKVIDKNTINTITNERVMIFNNHDKMIYNSSDNDSVKVSAELLNMVREAKEYPFMEGRKEAVGIIFMYNNIPYVVIASAYDAYGYEKLNNLKWIIIIGLFTSIGITVFTGRIYASRALKPIADVVTQVDKITISNLDMRVNEGNKTDEIAKLAITFNKMLERLESAFRMQKSFVSNASHELRTPLTAITGQIEVSLLNPRSQKEYENILESILEDIRKLNNLTNGLLDLAKASSDISAITLHPLRVDEILWEIRSELLCRNKDYKVSIEFKEPIAEELELTMLGNSQLMSSALINIMDNACKFSSDHSAVVSLFVEGQFLVVEISDKGPGIAETDIESIFYPFFRAKNVRNIPGSGLGLPLAKKIIELHSGTIAINSLINSGTTVRVSIPFQA